MNTFNIISSTNEMGQGTGIYIKKILAGNVGEVRRRLIASVETMGYEVIEEEPNIIGRRGTKGWGKWYASSDVLDYAMTLTVRLKAVGENSTLVTFDYLVYNPMSSKGDEAVIEQEANTITALSKKQFVEKICSVCEIESTDDSKFCRRCGTPLTSEQVEMETLRMIAEIQAGRASITNSSLSIFALIILTLIALILNLAGIIVFNPVFIMIGSLLLLSAAAASLFAGNRSKRALESPQKRTRQTPADISELPEEDEFTQLPPIRTTPASVTEGTTNLLDDEWKSRSPREQIPVSNRRNTNNFD